MCSYNSTKAFRSVARLFAGHPVEENDKFIAPQPKDDVLGPDCVFEDTGKGDHHFIPGAVADRVIYILKVIEIHIED